jgi:hypothetical protein
MFQYFFGGALRFRITYEFFFIIKKKFFDKKKKKMN